MASTFGQQPLPGHHAADQQCPPDPARHRQMLQAAADLRQQAIGRMRYMSLQHAKHAWELCYRDPLAPYGVAFLYAHPAGRDGWVTLSAATRLWLAEPDTSDLPRLLFSLNEQITAWPDPPVDVREVIANRADPAMTPNACYVGLGVTSLDTYSGTWEQTCARGDQYSHVPATIRIILTDGTTAVCERRGLNEYNTMTVHTSRALSFSALDAPYPYSSVRVEQLKTDPAHAQVLTMMELLHHTLCAVDNARLVATHDRATGRSRIPEQRT